MIVHKLSLSDNKNSICLVISYHFCMSFCFCRRRKKCLQQALKAIFQWHRLNHKHRQGVLKRYNKMLNLYIYYSFLKVNLNDQLVQKCFSGYMTFNWCIALYIYTQHNVAITAGLKVLLTHPDCTSVAQAF